MCQLKLENLPMDDVALREAILCGTTQPFVDFAKTEFKLLNYSGEVIVDTSIVNATLAMISEWDDEKQLCVLAILEAAFNGDLRELERAELMFGMGNYDFAELDAQEEEEADFLKLGYKKTDFGFIRLREWNNV